MLSDLRDDLDAVLEALADPAAAGAPPRHRRRARRRQRRGARIPGKHGADRSYAALVVLVDDTPGQLARLLDEIGELGVNLEDLRLEHSPGAPIGIVEVAVLPEAASRTRGGPAASADGGSPDDEHVVVAVDGPAGSGKSSVSRAAAATLGFAFLDTGAAYRALAWSVLEHGGDPERPGATSMRALDGFRLRDRRTTPTSTGCASAAPTSPTPSASPG